MSDWFAGQPKKECIQSQKIIVKTQKTEIQAVFKYHLKEDSLKTQKLKLPKTNNKIGRAIFIVDSFLPKEHIF